MSTAVPSWQDSELGTMKRAALWLVQVVGEGEIFTKTELREAFPDVAQIDRRMRDLRDFGWKIDTKREDIDLDANEQRYVQRGEPVWEPGRGTRPRSAITVNQRRELEPPTTTSAVRAVPPRETRTPTRRSQLSSTWPSVKSCCRTARRRSSTSSSATAAVSAASVPRTTSGLALRGRVAAFV